MRLFIDGEWNGFGGELLSLALVPEFEGPVSPWYMEFWFSPDEIDPWVAENVIPHLNGEKHCREGAQRSLAVYLNLPAFQPVHIVADWPEDIERLCNLLITGPGERIHIPRITFEVIPGLNTVSAHSDVPHNALEDARAIRKAVQLMETGGDGE